MTPQPALQLENIRHAFGNLQAVDDVSLTVAGGEVVCLVGPSGCGKSTVLRLAAGLEPLQRGKISMRGQMVGEGGARHLPSEHRHVGLVFQDFALFPHLTVAGNVAFGLRHLAPDRRQARVQECLRQVGMEEFAEGYPHHLSGGQQQRVALARALAPEPSILLLDEPFSGLDARLRDQVRDDTLRLLRASGTAALLVTHDPEEALFMADRIYLMRSGRIVQSGKPQDVYRQPVDLFSASFFSNVNRLQGTVHRGLVETIFGSLPAPDLSEGAKVVVAFRPEAVGLARLLLEPSLEAPGRVEEAHFLGVGWLLRIAVEAARAGGDSRTTTILVRMIGRPPKPGDAVTVSVPRDAVFLFPAD